jgi:hypothetical protein
VVDGIGIWVPGAKMNDAFVWTFLRFRVHQSMHLWLLVIAAAANVCFTVNRFRLMQAHLLGLVVSTWMGLVFFRD